MEAPALAFSFGVLALIIGSVFLLARKPDFRLGSKDAASRLFLEDYWDARIETVSLSEDGRAALLDLAGGEVGIVSAFGDRAVTRRLPERALCARLAEDGLELRLSDASLRRVRLVLDPTEAVRWTRRLGVGSGGQAQEARPA